MCNVFCPVTDQRLITPLLHKTHAIMKKVMLFCSALLLASASLFFFRKEKSNTGSIADKILNGPILYGITPGGVIYKVDVMNCTACPILDAQGFTAAADLVVLPNGNILVQTQDGLRLYNPPDPNPIWSDPLRFNGAILATNGLVYLSLFGVGGPPGLYVFDPSNNSISFIGSWPPNTSVAGFFYSNGVLYGWGGQGPNQIIILNVNILNPDQSTVVVPNAPFNVSGGITNDGYTTAISPTNILRQYTVSTNTVQDLCDLSLFIPFGQGFSGLSDLPTGVAEAPCLCTTFAGTVGNQTFNTCVPGSIAVPFNNNATLGSGDILRYILFSNSNDTLGSIIVQSSSPSITFNPATMQTGVTYYLATLAGDNLGGNVDLNDPCLDISNVAARVTWRERPAVTFTTANPNICAGQCTTVTANFAGVPPFTLTFTVPGIGPQTQTFAGNTGTFQVCVPANAVPGSFQIAAISLADFWCSCT
jgi:hypothetical protein